MFSLEADRRCRVSYTALNGGFLSEMSRRILVLLSLVTLIISGCGYKGPLVLPEQAAAETTEKDKKKKTR